MTFAGFLATRRDVKPHLIERKGYQCEDNTASVLVYADKFYIEQLDDGRYFLITDTDSVFSSDLGALERKLFDYALGVSTG
ncbi:MAG TPA: hypothetical protein VKX49_00150 [Bryobacteraceae bacterium]|nr:hypothetical protein [Bryobacteraceae bacterium]